PLLTVVRVLPRRRPKYRAHVRVDPRRPRYPPRRATLRLLRRSAARTSARTSVIASLASGGSGDGADGRPRNASSMPPLWRARCAVALAVESAPRLLSWRGALPGRLATRLAGGSTSGTLSPECRPRRPPVR